MPRRQIATIRINQWLNDWDNIQFDPVAKRRKPDKHFFLFKMKAGDLRKLSNIYRRVADRPRIEDVGVQREHKQERSIEISYFIKGGYPWSILSKRQKENPDHDKLKMPGWLPTSIIANILAPETVIGGKKLEERFSILINQKEGDAFEISLPENFEQEEWKPDVFPLSIIDGQHRLLSFDYIDELPGEFELPIVAFYNLDTTWQAYLFYTINIKPKKIKPSLAYDLFPILRTQDWLEKSPDGLQVYRETRAQEVTEILWSYPVSPWYKRINMLDQPGEGDVTQAAFIRTLLASIIKTSDVGEAYIGGLFGSKINDTEVVNWDRLQQGAFLVYAWQLLKKYVSASTDAWAQSIRPADWTVAMSDPAFSGKGTLLSTDQGVRVFSHLINDMVFEHSDALDLNSISVDEIDTGRKEQILDENTLDQDYLRQCIKAFEESAHLAEYLNHLIENTSHFDWRTSSANGLSPEEKVLKMAFRGSGGYRELRRQVLQFLKAKGTQEVKNVATSVIDKLGYN